MQPLYETALDRIKDINMDAELEPRSHFTYFSGTTKVRHQTVFWAYDNLDLAICITFHLPQIKEGISKRFLLPLEELPTDPLAITLVLATWVELEEKTKRRELNQLTLRILLAPLIIFITVALAAYFA